MSSDEMELVCVYLLIPFLLNGTELGLQLLLLLSTVHNLFNLSGMSAVGPCSMYTYDQFDQHNLYDESD